MTDGFIERIERSFNTLAPRGEELVDRFYANLFAKNPGVRPMFPANMGEQKKKLLGSLVLVVRNLRSSDKLREALMQMGARHVEYGTKPEHYPIVRDTLLDVMGQVAGDAWSEQLASDWKTAIDFVSEVMLEGQRQVVDAASNAG